MRVTKYQRCVESMGRGGTGQYDLAERKKRLESGWRKPEAAGNGQVASVIVSVNN